MPAEQGVDERHLVQIPCWFDAMRLAYETGAEASSRTAADAEVSLSLPLSDAAGRTLAADLRAAFDVPHYDSSAMDGFAVAGDPPWHLDDSSRTDTPTAPHPGTPTPLRPGWARTVVTGGRIPDGASGVVRVEYTARDDHRSVIDMAPGAPASELESGRHVRRAGREAAAGDLIAPAGRPLTPSLLAMAAICGYDEVQVRPAVTAALLLTGDEVRTSGIPGPGEVRDAFEVQLPHVLRAAGVDVVRVRRIGDSRKATAAALAELTDVADVVVTTGGTARSTADHVRAQLEAQAADVASACGQVIIGELAMRPGHPTMLAVVERTGSDASPHVPAGTMRSVPPAGARRSVPVLALPGNPLAAMAAMRVVGSALLRGLRGDDPEVPLTVPVAHDLPAEKVERLAPAAPSPRAGDTPTHARGETRWSPRTHVGSNMMRGLTTAQGWLVLPTRPVTEGDRVPFLPLEW